MGEAGGVEDVEGVVDAGLPGVGEVVTRSKPTAETASTMLAGERKSG